MKKLILIIVTLLNLGTAYALPVGNPAEASLFLQGAWWNCDVDSDPCFCWYHFWNVRLGYAGDFVFNRHLKLRSSHQGSDIDRTTLFTNAFYIALNYWNRVDIFGTLGASKLHIKTDALSWGFPGPGSLESELFFRSDFSWSIGARGTLWQCGCFLLGLEGQYFQTRTKLDNFLEYRAGTLTYFNDRNVVRYSDWQVALGASYRFFTSCPTLALIPYTALTWSGARLEFEHLSFTENFAGLFAPTQLTFRNLKSSRLWGVSVGISFILCDMVGVTVSGNFAAESSVYVNGQFRF